MPTRYNEINNGPPAEAKYFLYTFEEVLALTLLAFLTVALNLGIMSAAAGFDCTANGEGLGSRTASSS